MSEKRKLKRDYSSLYKFIVTYDKMNGTMHEESREDRINRKAGNIRQDAQGKTIVSGSRLKIERMGLYTVRNFFLEIYENIVTFKVDKNVATVAF